jgi:hypothetical protein
VGHCEESYFISAGNAEASSATIATNRIPSNREPIAATLSFVIHARTDNEVSEGHRTVPPETGAAENALLAPRWEASLCLSRVRAKSHSSRTTLALSSSRKRRSRSSMLPSLSAGTFECGLPQIVFECGLFQIVIESKLCEQQ